MFRVRFSLVFRVRFSLVVRVKVIKLLGSD